MMGLVLLSLVVLMLSLLSPLGASALLLLIPALVVGGFKWGRRRTSRSH
jgi:hypothetical protein